MAPSKQEHGKYARTMHEPNLDHPVCEWKKRAGSIQARKCNGIFCRLAFFTRERQVRQAETQRLSLRAPAVLAGR